MKRYGKLIAGALGLAAMAVADGLIGPPWSGYVHALLVVATLAGIYQAPKIDPPAALELEPGPPPAPAP